MALNEMDARLISQSAETTAIGSNALVSVAEGAGQPQKNIQLGNFADSMAQAVPQKTKDQVSITGLYAKTTDGKMVELTSESVASVVAGQTAFSQFLKPVASKEGSIDEIRLTSLCKPSVKGAYLCVFYDPSNPRGYFWLGCVLSDGVMASGQTVFEISKFNIEMPTIGWYFRPSITTDATSLKVISYHLS